MRYKNNVLDRLNQMDATLNKLQFQINRGVDQNTISDTTTSLKEQIAGIQEIISLEHDDFANQFANR